MESVEFLETIESLDAMDSMESNGIQWIHMLELPVYTVIQGIPSHFLSVHIMYGPTSFITRSSSVLHRGEMAVSEVCPFSDLATTMSMLRPSRHVWRKCEVLSSGSLKKFVRADSNIRKTQKLGRLFRISWLLSSLTTMLNQST